MAFDLVQLLEDGELSLSDTDRSVIGLISGEQESVARYYASWRVNAPFEALDIDLVIGRVFRDEAMSARVAISISCRPDGSVEFLRALDRPFAGRQAVYCSFPEIHSGAEEHAVFAATIADFIRCHDTRIPEVFRKTFKA